MPHHAPKRGLAGLGKAWLGSARLGKAWLGSARLGKAWLGSARLGWARQPGHGAANPCSGASLARLRTRSLEQPRSAIMNLKCYVVGGKGPEAGRPGVGWVPAVLAGATGLVH